MERGLKATSFSLAGVSTDELVQAGRALVEAEPRTNAELARALSERWPHADPAALAFAVRYLVPLGSSRPAACGRPARAARESRPRPRDLARPPARRPMSTP